jgi:hypothetical protein
MAATERRSLRFTSIDQIMPEVDRLLQGHATVGNWSLGQICDHLARAVNCTVDGYPVKAPWLIRRTVGPIFVSRMLRAGKFAEGIKTPQVYEPKPGADAQTEVEALRNALRRFSHHVGPLAEHPLAGKVSRSLWEQYHCIHCAHHLSFAFPVEPGREATNGPSQAH